MWRVIRDFLSCFWPSKAVYGEPDDDLTAYVRAVAKFGRNSDEAKAILRNHDGDEDFQLKAKMIFEK